MGQIVSRLPNPRRLWTVNPRRVPYVPAPNKFRWPAPGSQKAPTLPDDSRFDIKYFPRDPRHPVEQSEGSALAARSTPLHTPQPIWMNDPNLLEELDGRPLQFGRPSRFNRVGTLEGEK